MLGVFSDIQVYKGGATDEKLKELSTTIGHVVIDNEGTLAPAHIIIPQPDGSTTLVPMLDITESAEGLRVYFNVVGSRTNYLSNMWEKGMMWINKLGIKPLPTQDALHHLPHLERLQIPQ